MKFSKIKGEYIYYPPYCKICTIDKSNQWGVDNREQKYTTNRKFSKTKKNRKQALVRNQRYIEKGKRKEWEQENKDKLRQYQLNHQNHEISTMEWEDCKKYFNHRCAYCHLKIEEHWIKRNGNYQLGDFHRDHVDHNGANDLSNCVPACKTCNTQKRDFELEDWYSPNNENYEEDRLLKIHKWVNEDHMNFIKK